MVRGLSLLIFFLTIVWSSPSFALPSRNSFGVGIEPIIGYERVQKLLPTPHTKSRLIYGARLTAGIPLVSAEAEYTRGSDTEEFPESDLVTKDTDDRLKVGLTSGLRLSRIFVLNIRGGVQATKNKHEETTGGITTQIENPVVYDPYAGLSLTSAVARNFSLTGGVTVVFKEWPDMSKNDYQTTLGFSVRFP